MHSTNIFSRSLYTILLLDYGTEKFRLAARTRKNLLGSVRCHLHGGRSTGPKSADGKARSVAARVEGRKRWLQRQKAAKAAGLIKKIPGVRRTRGLPLRSKDRIIARGQRLIEQAIAMAKALPAVPDKSWEEMTDGEKFASNFSASLDFNHEVLNRHTNWEDTELLKLKKEIALSTQAAAIRVKVAELAPRSDDGVVNRLMARVAAIRRGERVIENDTGLDEASGSGDFGSQSDP